MRYQCSNCEAAQWRGFFPEPVFHIRFTIFHGIALGICGVCTKSLFHAFGYSTDGWRSGIASLGLCAILMFGFYAVAVIVEMITVSTQSCRECGAKGLRLLG
jgi:hypothetical protein